MDIGFTTNPPIEADLNVACPPADIDAEAFSFVVAAPAI